jgi:4-hydroxy-2-oxoheptanedioate aldolase
LTIPMIVAVGRGRAVDPTDLSHWLGLPGQVGHPTVHAAIQRILDIVAATELALGIMVNSAQAAQQWRARGARYIAVEMEALLMPAARGYLQAAPEG